MITRMNKIAGAFAALTILGMAMPIAAQADGFRDGHEKVVVVREDAGRRHNDDRFVERRDVRFDNRRDDHVDYRRDDHFGGRTDVQVVDYRRDDRFGGRVDYVAPREALQNQKNTMRNVATVGLATAAVGLLTHNNGLTAIGAIGAVAAGAQYEQDRKVQSETSHRW